MIFLNNLKTFNTTSLLETWRKNVVFWWSLVIISIISTIMLIIWLIILKEDSQNSSKPEFKIDKLNSYDSEVLNYFVTFIIPILSLKPNSWPSIVMNLILIVIEGIYFVGNNALYYNVLLIAIGYHIYTFDDNIVITRKKKSDFSLDETAVKQVGTTNIFYV